MNIAQQNTRWDHGELVTYLRYIYALFSPGRRVPVFDAGTQALGNLGNWTIDDKSFLIEEGRRQLDRQLSDLEQIRSRAQVVITTGIALGVAIMAILGSVANSPIDRGFWAFLLWAGALLSVLLSALGAVSIVTVRADMGAISATNLSTCAPPVIDHLAAAYARVVRVGASTVATRLTLLRIAILLLLLAAVLLAAAWWVMFS